MKNLLFLLSLCLFATASLAQQPSIEWEKSFGGSKSESVFRIINAPDGGYLVGSMTESNNGNVSGNHGASDMWLTKINSNGVLQWQKCYGGLDIEAVTGIDNSIDGGYIVVGNTYSNGAKNTSQVFGNRGGLDIWVVKIDENGTLEWRQCYGGCDRDESRAIHQTSDGNYVIVGGTLSINSGDVFGVHGDWDAWAFKIAPDGNLIWQKTIGGAGFDYLYALQETQNGELIVGGGSSSTNGDLAGANNQGGEDYWIAKLSTNGDLLWNKTYGGSDKDGVRGVCIATDGDIIVTGQTGSNDGDVTGAYGGFDAWILRLDSDGDLLWQKVLGGSAYESGFSIFQRADNDFIFAGETSSYDGDVVGQHGENDAWIVKFDENGDLKTSTCLGGSKNDHTRSTVPGANNSMIVAATIASSDGDVSLNHGLNDVWIVKLSVPLGLKPEAPNAEGLTLTISPNPASNLVQIVTNINGIKRVDIFDESGKFIQMLEMDQFEKSLPVNNFPAGIYHVRMMTQTGQILKAQFVKA
ncbi:MAG: T9SS type A sorting domain-containing protein [Lewinellaceae bacterium]|nr:T9SS type A sorting domain-containing protein [Lewinellaceae bacterium]